MSALARTGQGDIAFSYATAGAGCATLRAFSLGKKKQESTAMKFFFARAAEALLFSTVAAGVAIGALVATGSVDAAALFNAPPSNLLVAD